MADDYSDIIGQYKQSLQGNSVANTQAAESINPDAAAQALKRERDGGAPAVAAMQVNGSPPAINVSGIPHPAVVSWNQDPARAAASKDDIPALTGIVDAWEKIKATTNEEWAKAAKSADRVRNATSLKDIVKGSIDAVGHSISGVISPIGLTMGAATEDVSKYLPDSKSPYLTADENEKAKRDAIGFALGTLGAGGPKVTPRARIINDAPRPAAPPRPNKPAGPDGRFPTDDGGNVVDVSGAPMTFSHPRQAADWMLREDVKASDQLFDISNGEKEGTWVITQRGLHESEPVPPPPGASPVFDEAYVAEAQRGKEVIAAAQDAVAESKTAQRGLGQDFMDELGDEVIHVSPNAIAEIWQEGSERPFEDMSRDITQALARGGDVEIPLSKYLAETAGKPFAEKLNGAVRVREEGVSVDEAKELPKPKPVVEGEVSEPLVDGTDDIAEYDHAQHTAELEPAEAEEVTAVAPEIKKAVRRATRNNNLKPLFEDAKTLGMTEAQMERWGNKLQAALDAAHKTMFERLTKQLKKERGPAFKEALLQNTALVEQAFFERPDIQAYFYLRYGQHPNGAPLDGPVKLDYDTAVEQYGKERIDALPKELFTKQKNDPLASMREEINAKGSINETRIARMTALSMYGDGENTPHVVVKEVLQNSFDAVSRALVEGGLTKGKIDIANPEGHKITIKDNGDGMSPETIVGDFIKLAGSDKGDFSAGGLGLAKMATLYSADRIRVVSRKNGVTTVMNTTGEALYASMGADGIPIKVQVYRQADKLPNDVADLFPDGHGTYLEIDMPETYKDKEGVVQKIYMPYLGGMPAIIKSPLFRDIDVTVDGYSKAPTGANFPLENFKPFVTVKGSTFTARVLVSKEANKTWSENYHVLSNGLWQFDQRVTEDPTNIYSGLVPYEFYVDVRSHVKPEEGGYPFAWNRQRFADDIDKQMAVIRQYINKLYAYKKLADEASDFMRVRYIEQGPNGPQLSDWVDIKPEMPAKKTQFTGKDITEGARVEISADGTVLIDGSPVQELTPEQLKSEVPSADELIVNQLLMKFNHVLVMDNATIDGKPFSAYALEKYGQKFLDYIDLVGSRIKELRSMVSRFEGYGSLSMAQPTIAFDEYRGLSFKVPFVGKALNPFVPESSDSIEQAYGFIGTMVHEMAHYKVRSHNADFPAEMQRLTYKLMAMKTWDFVEWQKEFVEAYLPYADMVNEVKNEFDARNIKFGKLKPKDGARESDSDEGVARVPQGSSFDGTGAGDDGASAPRRGKYREPSVFQEGNSLGLSADELSQEFGYGSGDAMLRDIADLDTAIKATQLKSPKDYVKQLVKAQALNKTRLDEGFDLSPEGLAEAATEAFTAPTITDLLISELKELGKQVGFPIDKRAIEAEGQKTFAAMSVKQALKISDHVRYIRRNGVQAEQALLKGDVLTAFQAKQRQVLNQLILTNAFAFQKEFRSAERKLKTWSTNATMSGIDQPYLDRIHEIILGMQGKIPRFRDELARALGGVGLHKWVEIKAGQGEEIFYTFPSDQPPRAQSIQTFREMMDMLKSIAHAGAESQKFYNGAVAEDRATVFEELEAQATALPDKTPPNKLGGRKNVKETISGGAAELDAAQRQLSTVFDYLDNNNFNGVFNRMLANGAREAIYKKKQLEKTYMVPIAKAFMKIPKAIRNSYVSKIEDHPFINPLTGEKLEVIRGDVLPIVANMGTASNFERLAEGFGVEPDEIRRWVNDHVTKEEMDFIQEHIWNTFEELFPMIEKNKRERTGIGLHKEDALQVVTPHGVYDGGYFPVVYDPDLRWKLDIGVDTEEDILDPGYRVLAAPTGFEKARLSPSGALLLNLDQVLRRHMDSVFTQLAYGQYVRSAYKFIHSAEVKKYVTQKMGKEYYTQLDPWLRDQIYNIEPTLAAQAGIEKGMRILRHNVQRTFLGFSWSTGASQAVGLTATAAEIGASWTAVGATQFYTWAMTGQLQKMLLDKAPDLAHRLDSVQRDLLEEMETHRSIIKQAGEAKLAYERFGRMSLQYIGVMDFYTVSGPTWVGAYLKYKAQTPRGSDPGVVEDMARRYAAKVVEDTQGTGLQKDLSKIERNRAEAMKWLTIMYTWPGRFYNLQVEMVRDFKQGRPGAGLRKSMWLFIIGPIIQQLIQGNLPDTDDEEAALKWVIATIGLAPFTGHFFTRDAANYAQQTILHGYGQAGSSPISRVATYGTRAIKAGNINEDDKAIQTWLTLAGLTGILPGGAQIGKTSQYWWDRAHGDDHEENALEGTLYGVKQ